MRTLKSIENLEIISVAEYNQMVAIWDRLNTKAFVPRTKGYVVKVTNKYKFFDTLAGAKKFKDEQLKNHSLSINIIGISYNERYQKSIR